MGGRGQSSMSGDQPYWLSHRPRNPRKYPDEVATADNIVAGGLHPSDILEHPEYYAYMGEEGTRETVEILREM